MQRCFLLLGMLLAGSFSDAFADSALTPASRGLWIAKIVGPASFSPVGATGEDAWVPAKINVPVAEGASIFTQDQDQATEVELRWGGGAVRIAANTSLTVQRQDDQALLLVLKQGTLNVSLDAMEQDRQFEVATSNAAIQMTARGQYHFEADANGNANAIRVDAGQCIANGPSGQTVIGTGQTASLDGDTFRLNPPQPLSYAVYQAPAPSPGAGLNGGAASYNAGLYPQDADPGSDQLGAYGQWAALSSGQQAWYPNVGSDWAPFTDGRWQWVDPGGWTWIDNAAWGYTPSHYGRWGYAGRWYWVPGPPVYSPAVVAWVGTPQVVAWVPLAPGESVAGFVTVSRFANHAFLTAIPQQAFVSATPVSAVRMPFPRGSLDRAYVAGFVAVRPERLSILGSSVRAPQPPVAILQRSYFSSVQAAPAPLTLEARLQTYRASPVAGRPLERAALRSTVNDPAARPLAGSHAMAAGYGRPAGNLGGYGSASNGLPAGTARGYGSGGYGHPAANPGGYGSAGYTGYRNGGGYGQQRPGVAVAPRPGVGNQAPKVAAPPNQPGRYTAQRPVQPAARPQPQARSQPAAPPQASSAKHH